MEGGRKVFFLFFLFGNYCTFNITLVPKIKSTIAEFWSYWESILSNIMEAEHLTLKAPPKIHLITVGRFSTFIWAKSTGYFFRETSWPYLAVFVAIKQFFFSFSFFFYFFTFFSFVCGKSGKKSPSTIFSYPNQFVFCTCHSRKIENWNKI